MASKKPYQVIFRNATMALLLVLPFEFAFSQQKVQFTQYMFNGLVINPAYAGVDQALNLTFIQRKQWAGIEGSPSTQSLSAHTLFKKKNLGVGFSMINDKIGVHRNLSLLTSYAYHLNVGEKSYLSAGLQAGLGSRRSNYASIMPATSPDPRLNDAPISYMSLKLGMGFYFRSPKLHVGLSAPEFLPEHFTLNDTISVSISNANFFLFSKYILTVSENMDLEPSVLLKYLRGAPLSYDLNLNMIYRKVLTLGLSYRKNESVDFMLKGQITPQLQFGYAYDYVIGEVSQVSTGSHELMLNYVFRYAQTKVISPRQ